MTTVAAAQSAIRTRLEANFTTTPIYWQNEQNTLPDTPTAFCFAELLVESHGILSYGGGIGANEWRTEGRLEVQVLVPMGTAVATGYGYAESICAIFRGQILSGITYLGAEVFPGTGASDDGNYNHVATAICSLHFQKTG